MPTEKKLTKEDTWKPAELTKHMRDAGYGDDLSRRREEREKRARDNKDEERERRRARDNKDEERERRRERGTRDEETERRARDNKDEERERRRARDNKDEERASRRARGTRDEETERRVRDNKDEERESGRGRDPRDERHVERKREGGDEREKERRREGGDEREKERRRERDADRRGPDRDPQRHREGERERHKDCERERGDEREKRREERERDKRRGAGREREGEHDGEERERQKEREHRKEGDRQQDEQRDKERRERHAERKRLEEEKEKENNEERTRDRERRKENEERERRREKEERRREKEARGGRDEERERRHRERRQKQNKDSGAGESREPEATETRPHGDRETGERERRQARRQPVFPEPELPEPPGLPERTAAAEPEQTSRELAYEDDFEEYEEDFEELDESGGEEEEEEEQKEVEESPRQEMGGGGRKEVEAIQRAMEEENRRAGTAQSSRRSRSEEEIRPQESEQTHQGSPHRGYHRGPQRGKFMDFVAAKQREISQKVTSKQKKRSVELLRLVDLDFSPTFSLLDLPPLSEYDVYIKSFGNTNTKQAYVQCHEDDGEREVQTDLIQVLDKWTQHPADHTGACGDPGRSQDSPDGNKAQINIDSQRLAAFLPSAAQVMLVLLEEDHAERQSLRTTRTQKDALSFSEGNLQLNTQLPFLYGRSCSLLLFSSVRRQTLLSVHGPLDLPGAVRLDSWTLICAWNIWEPSRPQKILVYESEVSCCCFSPGESSLVLAGTSDGSLVLWDLREPAGGHYSMTIGETEWTFRHPTFSTDAVFFSSGHLSAVHSIEVLPSSFSSSSSDPQPPLLASEESTGMSFQLASLDGRGVLNLWVVLELPTASPAGSQTDLGLRPGGKVKLLHSSCLLAVEREGADIEALQLHFLPSDANHFLITTNMGVVHHGTAHGFRSPPRVYRSQEVGSRPLHVTSVHFSPFSPELFLVGCADGSMRLHIVSSQWPLAEWTTCGGGGDSGVGVVSVRWSQSRPAVFCVLDSASHLHLWDLSQDPLRPVVTEMLHADRVTAMAVFGSSSTSHQNSFSGVALAHRSGSLQLHYFNPSFSSANHTEEEDILQSMMHQAF